MSDGLELSANLWLPEPVAGAAEPQVFPAILEMIPYRKDDWRAASDESRGEAPERHNQESHGQDPAAIPKAVDLVPERPPEDRRAAPMEARRAVRR